MEPIRIVIPKYLREVKLSDSQRAIYWEWDGREIKAKNKGLLMKFVGNKTAFILANKKGHPSHLKKEYFIGATYNNEVVARIYKDVHVVEPELIKDALINGILKRKLTKRQVESVKFYLYESLGNGACAPIIDNELKVGTPRFVKIKGQDIYSGVVREFTRGEIMRQIKDSFRDAIKAIPVITSYPIRITMELHTPVKNVFDRSSDSIGQRWDIDNHCFPYVKAFPDVLMEEGKIVDDDRLHITEPPHGVFCPCDTEEDRKLVFVIQTDDRELIKNSPIWNKTNTMSTEV